MRRSQSGAAYEKRRIIARSAQISACGDVDALDHVRFGNSQLMQRVHAEDVQPLFVSRYRTPDRLAAFGGRPGFKPMRDRLRAQNARLADTCQGPHRRLHG